MRNLLICFLLLPCFTFASEELKLLEQAVQTTIYLSYSPNSKDEFNTKSEFLGDVAGTFKLYNHTYYFNNNSRAGHRLVIFTLSGELIGIYDIDDWATSINGDCVYFPVSEEWGNKICLNNGVFPDQALVNGQLPLLFK